MGQPAPEIVAPASRQTRARLVAELLTALAMTAGRGPVARAIISEARLTGADRAADVGCGPGTAVREAARHGVPVTGIDPSPVALRLARLLTRATADANITWIMGSAEPLPLPDGSATVLWSVSSVHHWDDQAAGLAEVWRVLAPGGRVLLAERLIRPGARGHASHGFTRAQAEELARGLASAGFAAVHSKILTAGRRTMVVVLADRAGPAQADPAQAGPAQADRAQAEPAQAGAAKAGREGQADPGSPTPRRPDSR
jgi:SAM-dependent methyltransferase